MRILFFVGFPAARRLRYYSSVWLLRPPASSRSHLWCCCCCCWLDNNSASCAFCCGVRPYTTSLTEPGCPPAACARAPQTAESFVPKCDEIGRSGDEVLRSHASIPITTHQCGPPLPRFFFCADCAFVFFPSRPPPPLALPGDEQAGECLIDRRRGRIREGLHPSQGAKNAHHRVLAKWAVATNQGLVDDLPQQRAGDAPQASLR